MFTPPAGHPALFERRALMPVINPNGKPEDAGNKEPVRHPAPWAPRLFADSASRAELEPLLRAGIINGITTNPTLIKRAGADSWLHAKAIMKDLCTLFRPHPVSLELTRVDVDGMVAQATELADLGSNAVIKVPAGGYRAVDPNADPYTGFEVIRRLWRRGIQVNTTLVFNTTQALWAANAGAAYVSPFLGRLSDYARKHDLPDGARGNSLYRADATAGGQPVMYNSAYVATGGPIDEIGSRLIFEIATVFANYRITTEILAASVRNPVQVTDCLLAGADIITVPTSVLRTIADHPLSDEGMKTFASDAAAFKA